MNAETTFRELLKRQLAEVCNSTDIGGDFVQMEHVEEKRDVLGEFIDYYRDECLDGQPFANEFSSDEIGFIRSFINYLNAEFEKSVNWSEVHERAGTLLSELRD